MSYKVVYVAIPAHQKSLVQIIMLTADINKANIAFLSSNPCVRAYMEDSNELNYNEEIA